MSAAGDRRLVVGGGYLGAVAAAIGFAVVMGAMVPAAADPAASTAAAAATAVTSDQVGVDGGDGRDDEVLLRLPLPTSPSPGDHPAAAPVPTPATRDGAPAVTVGDWLIPARVLRSYVSAARTLGQQEPGCHLPWQLVAAIGRIESDHAWLGEVTANGTTIRPIIGPALDGHPGVAAIRDTDGGRWDRDPVWDHAVGPMQFLPTTWARLGRDGNHDKRADPNNVDDAALAAGAYLCGYGRDLAVPSDLHTAVFAYNHSEAYVTAVLAWQAAYTTGRVVPVASAPSTAGPPPGSSLSTPPVVPPGSTAPPPTAFPLPTLPVPTESAGPTDSPSPSPSESPTPSDLPTDGPVPSDSPTDSPTDSPFPTDSPTESPTDTPTASPSDTPTDSATPTDSPAPSDSPSDTPTVLDSPPPSP